MLSSDQQARGALDVQRPLCGCEGPLSPGGVLHPKSEPEDMRRSTRAESRLSDPEAACPVAGEAAWPPALRETTAGAQWEPASLKGTGVKVHHLRLTLRTPDTPADDTRRLRQSCKATKGPTPRRAQHLHYVRQNRPRTHPPTPPTHTHTHLLSRGSMKMAENSYWVLFYPFSQE